MSNSFVVCLAIAAAVVVPSLRGLQWCAGIKKTEISVEISVDSWSASVNFQFLNPVS